MNERERDWLTRADRTGECIFTHFLDPVAAQELTAAAKSRGLECRCDGGCAEPERVLCAIYAPGNFSPPWPLEPLWIRWDSRFGSLSHRDILGALLGLGIAREQIGDIRLQESAAWICVGAGIASYVANALHMAGRVTVRVLAGEDMPAPEPVHGQERTINVATARLDAVLAAALNESRSRAQQLIRAGQVRLNWRECERVDAQLKDGDTLSIRGSGRIRIVSLEGLSRKGRQFIKIESLLGKD